MSSALGPSFIVFDGLDEGEVRRVVFVEVKTGKASLLSRERRCRDAIEAGRVEYQLLRLPAEVINAEDGAPTSAFPSIAASKCANERRGHVAEAAEAVQTASLLMLDLDRIEARP